MKRPWMPVLTCVFAFIFGASALADSNISYSKRKVRGVYVHVVTANLNSRNVKVSVAIARHGVGASEGFGSMLSRLKPAASITGTYFCTRTLKPVGHIVIDGSMVNHGCVGTGVCFTADNRVEFIPGKEAASIDWLKYETVLRTGPRLVRDGRMQVSPRTEGFRDRHLLGKSIRSALGVTKNNKLLLVTVSTQVYLSTLAWIMHDLGAVNAVNLDGGSSTALSYRSRVFSHPGRRLTNLLVVYDSPLAYARSKSKLCVDRTKCAEHSPKPHG